jgi:hypothetical protein
MLGDDRVFSENGERTRLLRERNSRVRAEEPTHDARPSGVLPVLEKFPILFRIYRGQPQRKDDYLGLVAELHNFPGLGRLAWEEQPWARYPWPSAMLGMLLCRTAVVLSVSGRGRKGRAPAGQTRRGSLCVMCAPLLFDRAGAPERRKRQMLRTPSPTTSSTSMVSTV